MARSLRVTVRVRGEGGQVVAFAPGDRVPGWAAAKILNPRVWVEGPEPDPVPKVEPEPEVEVEPEVVTYSGWTVTKLRDEIVDRNQGRDPGDRIPTDGIKTELVAALEADDRK